MPLLGRSLLDIDNLTEADVFSLFSTTRRIRGSHQKNRLDFVQLLRANASRYVAMVFLEPSTRTRASFEVAAYKLGLQVLCPEFGSSSSLVKGESEVDTILNIAAMDPDVLVVRYGHLPELDELFADFKIPVINAGSGLQAHPTQALLDGFTIYEQLGSVRGQKVLIVGDILHSRVAQSNIKMLRILGAEVAVCGPREFLPDHDANLQEFSLDEGLQWASVVMALRIQLERHQISQHVSPAQYHEQYGITVERMKKLGGGILMHPGPINQGVELAPEVLRDPRCRILTQVQNGVYTRAAILASILGIKF